MTFFWVCPSGQAPIPAATRISWGKSREGMHSQEGTESGAVAFSSFSFISVVYFLCQVSSGATEFPLPGQNPSIEFDEFVEPCVCVCCVCVWLPSVRFTRCSLTHCKFSFLEGACLSCMAWLL